MMMFIKKYTYMYVNVYFLINIIIASTVDYLNFTGLSLITGELKGFDICFIIYTHLFLQYITDFY